MLLLLCMLMGLVQLPQGLVLKAFAADEPSDEDVIFTDGSQGQESAAEEDDNILFSAELPTYYQNDYAYVRFGSGTVANNGCSVTALAMVASYMTGHPYTPDALADYFGGRAENNIARLEIASRALQLTYRKAKDWNQVYDALQKGKIAIVLVSAPSAFTNSQHFIVLHGITKDGRVLVTDPNNQNHLKWDLQQGFENGFDTYEIWSCWEGGWIYDKAAMPKNPIFYQEPRIDHSNPRFPDVESRLTPDDIDLMAKVVWAEARGESLEGQRAVAEVILNRLNSPNFPDNLHDVIYGEGQFRTAWQLDEATPYQTQYEAVEMALYGPDYVLPETVVYFAWEKVNNNVWGWIGRHVFCHEFNMPAEQSEDPEALPDASRQEEPAAQEAEDDGILPDEPASDAAVSDAAAADVPINEEEVSVPDTPVSEGLAGHSGGSE